MESSVFGVRSWPTGSSGCTIEFPKIALRAEVDTPARLLDRVQDGSLDLAVLYNPPQRPDLIADLLVEEKLIMVATASDRVLSPEQYVYVDWGPAFAANHQAAFPGLSSPSRFDFARPLSAHIYSHRRRLRIFSKRHRSAGFGQWTPAPGRRSARVFP